MGNSLWKFVFYALAVVVGFCGVVGSLLVFGYQVFMWLYWGQWIPISLADLWLPPYWTVGWLDVHKIVVRWMSWPLVVSLLLVGVVGAWLLGVIAQLPTWADDELPR